MSPSLWVLVALAPVVGSVAKVAIKEIFETIRYRYILREGTADERCRLLGAQTAYRAAEPGPWRALRRRQRV